MDAFQYQNDDESLAAVSVAEAEELTVLAAKAASNGGRDAHAVFDRFKSILDEYREQSELLDPLLERLVSPLAVVLRAAAAAGPASHDFAGLRGASRLLWAVATTRGRKTVMRFLPNTAADLEPVLALLERLNTAEGSAPGVMEGAEEGTWEVRCVLLLWLAILVLVPFDLATMDSRTTESEAALAQRLADLCRGCLDSPGPEREVAALVLGRLLTRRDTERVLEDFLAWAPKAVIAANAQAAFLLPGVAATLAEVFKAAPRGQAAALAQRLTGLALSLGELPAAASSSLARRLLVKLAVRMALALLPPAPASWRHTTRVAALHATLQRPQPGGGVAAANGAAADGAAAASSVYDMSLVAPAISAVVPPGQAAGQADSMAEAMDAGPAPAVHIPDEVEDIAGQLLQSLRDPDTVVRWSAAKGVGRVTGRLPAAAGGEIVDSILQELEDAGTYDEAPRHGCCLALAELARRGLLPPHRLPEALPHITAALHYDVRRGAHSLGAAVRDAAAYVCWAVSRSYAPDEVAPIVQQLAPALLTAAVLDREVACRRAAAAAFQEAVGRLGSFPDGIALLTAADYFTLSSRAQAYTVVAPQVAAYPAYRQPMANALLRVKLRQWDSTLRSLAAEAAANLVPLDPGFWARTAVPELRSAALNNTLEVRHGALLGLSKLLPALAAAGGSTGLDVHLDAQQQASLAALVHDVEAARLLRGRGGEPMRAALCRFIEGLSSARLSLTEEQVHKLLVFLEEQLAHTADAVHEAAAAALGAFSRAYWLPAGDSVAAQRVAMPVGTSDSAQQDFVTRCQSRLAAVQSVPAAARGAAAALGVLPAPVLAPAAADILQGLAAVARVQEELSADDAAASIEARVAAVKALAAVPLELFASQTNHWQEHAGSIAGGGSNAVHLLGDVICGALLAAMDDYTTDNRGDVGSWVREAAMAGLVQVLPLLAAAAPDTAALFVTLAAAAMVKQAVERIARLRQAAGGHLQALLDCQPALPGVLQRAALGAALSRLGPDGCASLQGLPLLAALLPAPQLRPALLQGLATGLGGLDAQLASAAAGALVSVLVMQPGGGDAANDGTSAGSEGGYGGGGIAPAAAFGSNELLRAVLDDLPALWRQCNRSSRMCLPLLRLALLLLTECAAARLWPSCPPTVAGTASAGADQRRLQALLEGVKAQGRGCGDVGRMCAVAEALCRLSACGPPVREVALSGVLTLLVSRISRVRRHAAEHLYIELLASPEPSPGSQNSISDALRVLAGCSWDGDVGAAKAARQQLYPLLGVSPPAATARPRSAGRQRAPGGQRRADASGQQGSSYQQLIDVAARR